MDDVQTVYTPGEAARILGVTTQSLRRYADDYGAVFEPVVQRGKQREFDDTFIARLRQAQVLQQANKVPSILVGLERLRDGIATGEVAEHPTPQTPFEQAVLEQLRALGEMVVQLSEDNKVLRAQVRQLETSRESNETETARMNKYLLGELERHRVEAEQKTQRRSWWQVWGRR